MGITQAHGRWGRKSICREFTLGAPRAASLHQSMVFVASGSHCPLVCTGKQFPLISEEIHTCTPFSFKWLQPLDTRMQHPSTCTEMQCPLTCPGYVVPLDLQRRSAQKQPRDSNAIPRPLPTGTQRPLTRTGIQHPRTCTVLCDARGRSARSLPETRRNDASHVNLASAWDGSHPSCVCPPRARSVRSSAEPRAPHGPCRHRSRASPGAREAQETTARETHHSPKTNLFVLCCATESGSCLWL